MFCPSWRVRQLTLNIHNFSAPKWSQKNKKVHTNKTSVSHPITSRPREGNGGGGKVWIRYRKKQPYRYISLFYPGGGVGWGGSLSFSCKLSPTFLKHAHTHTHTHSRWCFLFRSIIRGQPRPPVLPLKSPLLCLWDLDSCPQGGGEKKKKGKKSTTLVAALSHPCWTSRPRPGNREGIYRSVLFFFF